MGFLSERFFTALRANFKHQFLPHLCLAVLMALVSPLIMGTKNLAAAQTAAVYELYIALLGIVLLTPVFRPEQDADTLALTAAKATGPSAIWILRAAYSVLTLALCFVLYGLFLKVGGCEISVKLICGGFAGALFLGGMGMFAAAAFSSQVIGYMLPAAFFIFAVGAGRKLGILWLFSMRAGEYMPKPYLAAFGLLLMCAGIFTAQLRLKNNL